MKSHDFGQYLFNASILNERQLAQILSSKKKATPNLATKALFLRLVSAKELTTLFRKNFVDKNLDDYLHSHNFKMQSEYDEIVKNLLNARQLDKVKKFDESQSLCLAQKLIDDGVVNFAKLERILKAYHHLEIPPLEEAFAAHYDALQEKYRTNYLLALDVMKSLYDFLSKSLGMTMILLPAVETKEDFLVGTSVKITGAMPFVIGVIANRKVFHELAVAYEKFVTDTVEDDFDALAEMLNVFTGHFTVKIASEFGLEEEPEPPRFDRVTKKIDMIKMLADAGIFYLYIGTEEIFSNPNT